MARDYIFVSYSHKDEEWLDRLRIVFRLQRIRTAVVGNAVNPVRC